VYLGACRDLQVFDLVLESFQNGLNLIATADELADAFALQWVFNLVGL
jgi:hypothetical protein